MDHEARKVMTWHIYTHVIVEYRPLNALMLNEWHDTPRSNPAREQERMR